MLPGKQDVADSCPVAVDAQKSEGERDLGHPGAASLNQEVDEHQAEGSQEGEHRPVLRAAIEKLHSFHTFWAPYIKSRN